MHQADPLGMARAIVLDSAEPAFLVDAGGAVLAWNTAAAGFFGIAAWRASARSCREVIGCEIRTSHCPLQGGRCEPQQLTTFALPGVEPAGLRHTPVLDGDGDLLAMIHEVNPLPAAEPI